MSDLKMNYAFKIQNLTQRFQLNLLFHTYRETSAYCIFDMISNSRIKEIQKYEEEFQNSIDHKVSLTAGNGFVRVIIPKENREPVLLKKILNDNFYHNCDGTLKVAIGENLSGGHVVGDLEDWVHVLIAGESGSGKSLFLHTVILSLIYCCNPSILKFILMDLNKAEFSIYEDMCYLEKPVIYNDKQAKYALEWLIKEMKKRFDILKSSGYRNLKSYNKNNGTLPYIVVIIDEFQNLTLRNKDLEKDIVEIVSQARKVGIHVLLSTQRPSADIVTPLIKSNMPTRIAFSVPSHYDSQIIIDETGAEKLGKKGDMLLKDADGLQRIQGAYVSDEELEEFVRNLEKRLFDELCYDESILELDYIEETNELDQTYQEAIEFVLGTGRCNQWVLKNHLNRGNKIVDEIIQRMQDENIISQQKVGHNYEILKGEF